MWRNRVQARYDEVDLARGFIHDAILLFNCTRTHHAVHTLGDELRPVKKVRYQFLVKFPLRWHRSSPFGIV
jgi:hypothetical protein